MASPRVMPNRDKGWYDRIGEKLTVRYILSPRTSISLNQNLSLPPQKPSPITMALVTNRPLLLKPLPLSSNRLNTRKKNIWTNQLFVEMTLHLPDSLLSIHIHRKLKNTLPFAISFTIVWYHELVVHGRKKGIMLRFLYLIPSLVITSFDVYAFGLFYAFGLLTDYAISRHPWAI